MPEDYHTWYKTMCAEFPSRFSRLFWGPMSSGLPPNLQEDPLTVSIILYDTLICIPLFSCIIIKNEHSEGSLILSHTNNIVLFCYA